MAEMAKLSINKNGTYDYGVFQINSIWLPKIAAYGYSKDDIQYNACKNTQVATWIISQQIASGKNLWDGIANYHSRTLNHHRSYKADVYKNYRYLSQITT